MNYIKQKNSNTFLTNITQEEVNENHHCFIENPGVFEIVTLDTLPEDHQFLIYESPVS